MTFLPIVGRELSVTARRAGTYWLRFWAALTVLAIWLFLLSAARRITPAEMGQLLLNALGVLALGFSLLAGVFLTADCLAEEKREGTLGLLFLTDLRSYDVVLGKLAACSLHAFFGLLATFPILGLTLFLGGVTGNEFARLMLVFAVTLFFSLGIGMFVSAISSEARQAMTRALLLIVIFAGICPAIWWGIVLLASFRSGTPPAPGAFPPHLLLPSPAYAYIEAADLQYRFGTGARDFWLSLGIVFGIGLAGVVLAGVLLPRAWRDLGVKTSAPARSRERHSDFAAENAFQRRLLLQWNPCYWLAVRDAGTRKAARWVLLLLVPVWAVFWGAGVYPRVQGSGNDPVPPFLISMFIAYGLHVVIKLLFATEASRRLNQDRQSGALEILLATPVSVGLILRGQNRALWRHFRWPFLVLGLVNIALAYAAITVGQLQMDRQDKIAFSELFLGGIGLLLTDFYALSWIGMWRGLVTPKHPRAVVGTVGRVMGPGWLAIFFLIFMRPDFSGPDAVIEVFAAWLVFGVAVDVALGLIARRRLRVEFRRVAAEGLRAKVAA